MSVSPLAGKPAPPELLINLDELERLYLTGEPDISRPEHQVRFGTGGHRGSPYDGSFTETHILAITQAICDYREEQGIDGPLFLGKDTHAASAPAERTCLEVLAANGVEVRMQENDGYTPTPVVSRAILCYNRDRESGLADGIIITPSHNPPTDGGIKYNGPNGGGADTDVTTKMQERANEILQGGNADVKRMDYDAAIKAPTTQAIDLSRDYIDDLRNVIDMDAIRASGLRLGADPLGGASVNYWGAIAEHYGLDLTVVHPTVDKTFGFMSVDHDGKLRMDCSSPWAMAATLEMKNDFDLAFGNDPDADRHGIITPSAGLMNPNHYLPVAIKYLFANRPNWPAAAAVGKTLVSSSMIDRVTAEIGRELYEVPVGFKWFVEGLFTGKLGFGGEESAGGSFLRFDGTAWSTDKDGIILDLLAAEITAKTGDEPGLQYQRMEEKYGKAYYSRVDQPCSLGEKSRLSQLSPSSLTATELAGEPIQQGLTHAPGNNAPIGGLKISTENGWFAARPSGTESIYKIYAESFLGESHLNTILEEARRIVTDTLA